MTTNKYLRNKLEKMKRGIAILTVSVMSASSFAPLLVQSTYIAHAEDEFTSTTTTGTTTNGTTTGTSSDPWWLNPPTPPTPPAPPVWTWPGFPENGTSTGTSTGTSSNPWWWWNFPTPPTPPTSPAPGTTTSPTTGTTTASTTARVVILKYVDGAQATASSSNNTTFNMTAVYNATSTGSGTSPYTLGPTGGNPYQAMTINFAPGADYSTYEVMDSNTGTLACVNASSTATTTATSSTPFSLLGYSWGDTLAQAIAAPVTTITPSFTNLQSDKYVIVWNDNCATAGTGGTIGGDVTGGATSTVGVLHVDSITTVNSNATADGTFGNGWKYLFNITVPTNELNLAMKFSDWMMTNGSGTIPVANNMRISSAQANSTSTVLLTAQNTYSSPLLNLTGTDLDSNMAGKQVQVLVETSVPVNTTNGSYTTSYGIKTQ